MVVINSKQIEQNAGTVRFRYFYVTENSSEFPVIQNAPLRMRTRAIGIMSQKRPRSARESRLRDSFLRKTQDSWQFGENPTSFLGDIENGTG